MKTEIRVRRLRKAMSAEPPYETFSSIHELHSQPPLLDTCARILQARTTFTTSSRSAFTDHGPVTTYDTPTHNDLPRSSPLAPRLIVDSLAPSIANLEPTARAAVVALPAAHGAEVHGRELRRWRNGRDVVVL